MRALVLSSPVVFASGACAEKQKIDVSSDEPTGMGIPPGEQEKIERCGEDGILCGDGCCPAGNTCSPTARCIPAAACATSEDCGSDSLCGGRDQCVPWDSYPEDLRFNNNCRTSVNLPSLQPEVQCSWPGPNPPSEFPDSIQVIATPMVVDFNFDNNPATWKPSIVFISYEGLAATASGVLRVIDGDTCRLQATIPGVNPFTQKVSPALGDINGDGRPDIVVGDERPFGASVESGVAAFSPDGFGETKFIELGRARVPSTAGIQGVALHNLDDDDRPEILTETSILELSEELGDTLVATTGLQRPPPYEQLTGREPPIVVDIDGDTRPEMITSQGILVWDTTNPDMPLIRDKSRSANLVDDPLWEQPDNIPGFFMALADLGEFRTALPAQADSAEMIVVGSGGNLWVRQIDGRAIHEVSGKAGGPPVVADFDGDGRMEFASPGQGKITVFDLDCVAGDDALFNAAGCKGTPNADGILWQSEPTQGALSGAAVFDFDGDKRAEVVFADQCFMRVYDGLTGDVLFSVPRSSTTNWDYPVVADVDGDTNSELVTASNNNDNTLGCPTSDPYNPSVLFEATAGVTVWAVADDSWMGSRPIWNQHNYYVTNVEDDGTIPPTALSHWNLERSPGPNTFRQNVQGETGASLDKPDITTAGLPQFKCNDFQDLATVTVDVCNRGLLPLRAGEVSLALVHSDRLNLGVCAPMTNTAPIGAGECVEMACDAQVIKGAPPFDITVMGDYRAEHDECNEFNNTSLISRVSCIRIVE